MNKRYCLLYIIIVSVLTCMSGCNKEKRYRIGISQCSDDDWRNKMNEEIMREVMFHPEAEVEIRSADDNNEKQIADIHYFADNDFDIIIASPNEADAVTPVIKEVYESGIPVIVFDRDINGNTYTASQGADNYAIGLAAAQYAYHLIGDGGKVIEIYGRSGSTPAIDRNRGFRDKAKELRLDVIAQAYGNWNYEEAAVVADSLLTLHPDAKLVYAHNDRMAIAASDVAKKKGMDIKVIGIDAAPEIGIKAVADGVIDATFLYPTDAYRLIRTALDILNGRPYQRDVRLPVSSAVDQSNADILLFQNESLQEETDKIKKLKWQVDDYLTKHSAQTTLFYAAIAILILLFVLLFMVLRAFWQKKKTQSLLEEQNQLLAEQRDKQKSLNEQLNAATQSKLVFFTNVSHDLRTPLTLISEPVETLEKADYLEPEHKALMHIAGKNVKILRRLINQILDFRKYENGKLQVNLTEVKIAALLAEWADSFTAIARKRDLKLTVDIRIPDSMTMAIDTEKIERVFFNLMSNAFKYTPRNGRIALECLIQDDALVFSVADTGQGISAEDLSNIFDRFYQVDRVHPNGSGIGLSLAKAFVELHDGSIEVESTLGQGSVFTVRIPVRHTDADAASEPVSVITEEEINAELADTAEVVNNPVNDDSDRPLLLVIDDNEDIRSLIRQLLSDTYRIIEARNGKDGIRLASKYVPDLIICDVMMPVMDGLECCRRLKQEVTTSHIPVLMLTACIMDEQRIQGYESGADGYLSKPFNVTMLRMRCENLIENRKRIRNVLESAGTLLNDTEATKRASEPARQNVPGAPTDIDSQFYDRFVALVTERMSDADMNVEALASKLGIGRSLFYRKIKALTNYSPVELIRKIRLATARDLVASTDKPISEICYEVGFSAPAYFTKVFRETFGESPSEMRERLGR